METDDQDSIRRGFVLESIAGRYRSTPLSTVGELQFQLMSTPRIIVLPGQLDEAIIQVLTSYGIPREFLKAHLEDKEYSGRGSRPQDAVTAYFWQIPQFVRCCGNCTTEDLYTQPILEDRWYYLGFHCGCKSKAVYLSCSYNDL